MMKDYHLTTTSLLLAVAVLLLSSGRNSCLGFAPPQRTVAARTTSLGMVDGPRQRKMRTTAAENDPNAQICDMSFTLPVITAYVGIQAMLPSTVKGCDASVMWPNDTGFCPASYWNLGAVAPGIVLIITAFQLLVYLTSNRLVFYKDAIATASVSKNRIVSTPSSKTNFRDIGSYKVSPVGLYVETKSGDKRFYPLAWDDKTISALLEKNTNVKV